VKSQEGAFSGCFPCLSAQPSLGFLRVDLSRYGIHSKPNGLPLKL
jgi:hypothetical protein